MAGTNFSRGNLPPNSIDDSEIRKGLSAGDINAEDMLLNSAGFSGNLTPSITNSQLLAEAVDSLVIGGGGINPDSTFFVSPGFSDSGNQFSTVQGAVDAAQAVSGPSNKCLVVVYPGVYTETVTITAAGYISIKGIGKRHSARITGNILIKKTAVYLEDLYFAYDSTNDYAIDAFAETENVIVTDHRCLFTNFPHNMRTRRASSNLADIKSFDGYYILADGSSVFTQNAPSLTNSFSIMQGCTIEALPGFTVRQATISNGIFYSINNTLKDCNEHVAQISGTVYSGGNVYNTGANTGTINYLYSDNLLDTNEIRQLNTSGIKFKDESDNIIANILFAKWLLGDTADGDTAPSERLHILGNILNETPGIDEIEILVDAAKAVQIVLNTGPDALSFFKQGRVAVGKATIDPSALVELFSTDKGLLGIRQTTVQKNAISSPADGLSLHDTDRKNPEFFNGTYWEQPGQSKSTKEVATNYNPSVLTNDYEIVFTDTSSAWTYTIPTEDIASGSTSKRRYVHISDKSGNAGTNNITVAVESGSIFGNAVISSNYGAITIALDGTNAYVVGRT